MAPLTCASLAAEMKRIEDETVISNVPCGGVPDHSVSEAIYNLAARQAAEFGSEVDREKFFQPGPDACDHLDKGNAQHIVDEEVVGFESRGCSKVAQKIREQRMIMNFMRPEDDVDGAILEREIVVLNETLRQAPENCPFLRLKKFIQVSRLCEAIDEVMDQTAVTDAPCSAIPEQGLSVILEPGVSEEELRSEARRQAVQDETAFDRGPRSCKNLDFGATRRVNRGKLEGFSFGGCSAVADKLGDLRFKLGLFIGVDNEKKERLENKLGVSEQQFIDQIKGVSEGAPENCPFRIKIMEVLNEA
jgi:hypothetical protein